MQTPHPRRGLWLSSLAAVGCGVFGVLPLLGLPGALVFELSQPVAAVILGASALAALPADAAWPIAIVVTLLWPVSIVAGYVLAFRLTWAKSLVGRLAIFVAVLYGWGVLLSIWCITSAMPGPLD